MFGVVRFRNSRLWRRAFERHRVSFRRSNMSKNGIQIYNFELKQKNQFLIRKNLQRKNRHKERDKEKRRKMEAQNQQQQLLLQQYLQYQSLQQQQAQLPQLPDEAMLRMNLLMMAQLQAQQELLNKQMMFSRVDQGYYTSSASSGSSPVRDLESPPPAPKKSRKRQKSKDLESKSARKQQKSSSQEKQTFLGLYEVYGVIGVGGGGMVYSGRRITDGLPVAIKRVMREKVKRWEAVDGHKVPQEIALMLR